VHFYWQLQWKVNQYATVNIRGLIAGLPQTREADNPNLQKKETPMFDRILSVLFVLFVTIPLTVITVGFFAIHPILGIYGFIMGGIIIIGAIDATIH
jgi:hypothetical protein